MLDFDSLLKEYAADRKAKLRQMIKDPDILQEAETAADQEMIIYVEPFVMFMKTHAKAVTDPTFSEMHRSSMGLIKDMPCSICGSVGKTTRVVFGKCSLSWCEDHAEEEVQAFRAEKRRQMDEENEEFRRRHSNDVH